MVGVGVGSFDDESVPKIRGSLMAASSPGNRFDQAPVSNGCIYNQASQ